MHLAFRRRRPQSQILHFVCSPLARDFVVTRRRPSIALSLVGCFMLAGMARVMAIPSPMELENPSLGVAAISGATKLAQTQPAPAPGPGPPPPPPPLPGAVPAPAAPAPAAADEPIGNVATLT